MKWFFYNVLFTIAYWVMMPKFLCRMCRRGGYANRFADRLGYYPKEILNRLQDGTPRIWIHAVSVGEVAVAKQMMQEMRTQNHALQFVLSTTSSTGWSQSDKDLNPADILIYAPIDYPDCVQRAIKAINPICYIVTETEIWPNVLRQCHAKKLPIFLINARISDHSAPGYKRLKWWFGSVLNLFTKIFAQSELDRQRILDAGCAPDKVVVSGSMKFDVAQRAPAQEAALKAYVCEHGFALDAPILIGGSTWPGEDSVMLRLYSALKAHLPALRLIIAPRHFEKADAVEMSITQAGFACVRKSRNDPAPAPDQEAVILADTTGELMGLFGISTYAFVGKSLCEHGSQNMIEPCLCGCLTAVGPYTENFRPVMSDLLDAQAIIQAKDEADLTTSMIALINDPNAADALKQRAAETVKKRRGTTAILAKTILKACVPHGI